MKVLLMSPYYESISNHLAPLFKDFHATKNFEEVQAMAKSGEVTSLCIIGGGYNYSKRACNTIDGTQAVKELHEINPSLPIFVLDGTYLEEAPVKNANVTFSSMKDFDYDVDKSLKAIEEFLAADS